MNNRWKFRAAKILMTAGMAVFMAMESFAATGRIAFSDPSAKVGDEVSVTMKFSTLDGSALGNTDVMLAYDATSLSYINETENANGDAGAIRVWSAPTGASEASTVLRFKAIKPGSTSITVTSYEAYDNNGQSIEVEKKGTSAVTISALETSSNDATLQSLQVSPGTLSPAFSPSVKEYSVTVGLDTADLTVSAVANNKNAKVNVEGASDLKEGENTVSCKVTAENGSSTDTYKITVTKVEGGEAIAAVGETAANTEAPQEEPEVLATLDVTAKKIRITNLPEGVEIPSGFRESSIAIGDAKVPGWTWAADESPRYCVFYGMNDAGEQNFYRYDLSEKTVQRYFEDQGASSHSAEEFDSLAENYNSLVDDYRLSRILMFAFIALSAVLCIVLFLVTRGGGRKNDSHSEVNVSRRANKNVQKNSGKKLSREERYMRGEEDDYLEEDPEEKNLDEEDFKKSHKPDEIEEIYPDEAAAEMEEELASDLAKEAYPDAGSHVEHNMNKEKKDDSGDDFEFFDL